MVQIAVENPIFRDSTSTLLAPTFDLRGASVSIEGRKISTTVRTDDPPKPQSLKFGSNVSQPGKSFRQTLGSSNFARTRIGSDTLVELATGIEQLDSGIVAPVDRIGPFAQNRVVDPVEVKPKEAYTRQVDVEGTRRILDPVDVGRDRNDTGQTPVKLEIAFNPSVADKDVLQASLEQPVQPFVPMSFFLPKPAPAPGSSLGRTFDLLA